MTASFPLTRLAGKYNQMQKDGRILSTRHSIEIVRKRIAQLLERIDENEFPDRMEKLQKLWDEFKEADSGGDRIEAIKIKGKIDKEFEAAYHDYKAWQQIFEAVDIDRKLVESEVKVAKDLRAILTAEDAYELTAKLFASMMSAVSQEPRIPDNVKSHLLKRIEYEFTRIIGDGESGERTDAGLEEEVPGSVRETIDA